MLRGHDVESDVRDKTTHLPEQGSKKAIETITLTDDRENLSTDHSALSLMLIA
jgi:hypothetical protein